MRPADWRCCRRSRTYCSPKAVHAEPVPPVRRGCRCRAAKHVIDEPPEEVSESLPAPSPMSRAGVAGGAEGVVAGPPTMVMLLPPVDDSESCRCRRTW